MCGPPPAALLLIVTAAAREPVDVGLNVTVTVHVAPGECPRKLQFSLSAKSPGWAPDHGDISHAERRRAGAGDSDRLRRARRADSVVAECR